MRGRPRTEEPSVHTVLSLTPNPSTFSKGGAFCGQSRALAGLGQQWKLCFWGPGSKKEKGLRACRTEEESSPQGPELDCMGSGAPAWVGFAVSAALAAVASLCLSWGWATGSLVPKVLSLSSWTLHHGPFTSRGPTACFLPRLSLAHPQNVLGISISSLCAHIYPTLMLFSSLCPVYCCPSKTPF